MSDVTIIGCGPAGLLAAHAVVRAGHHPTIYSREPNPSPNARGVFLHRAIPEVTFEDEADTISLIAVGSPRTYAEKVYGSEDHPTSWDKYANRGVRGWPLEPTYARLWGLYRHLVVQREINAEDAEGLELERRLTINTAPAYVLCRNRPPLQGRSSSWGFHQFPSRTVYVRPEAPSGLPDNTMMYNGRPEDPWYRASNLFGSGFTEYGRPQPQCGEGIKVQATDCDCNPLIHRAGRWGTWKPGVLLHHAFETAEELCRAL